MNEAGSRSANVYELPDPELSAYDHGLGTLRVEGELKGYLASVVGSIAFPSRSPWPWFVIVWADGFKEPPFEDYGPGWWTVRELDAGYLDHFAQGVAREKRFFGVQFWARKQGPPCRSDFAWLPAEEAAKKWQELGLVDADF